MSIVRVPCANPGCGSDLVREERSFIDRRTGKPAEVRHWSLQASLLTLCCALLAAVQLLRSSAGRIVLDFSVVGGFALISLVSLVLLAQPHIVARFIPTEPLHTYTCQICGHRWQIRAGVEVSANVATNAAHST